MIFELVHRLLILYQDYSSAFLTVVIFLLLEFVRRSGLIASACLQLGRLPERFEFVFLVLNKAPEFADFIVTVLAEVESKLLAEPQLQKVVVQRFFADLDLCGGIFEGPALQLLLIGPLVHNEDSIVELTPSADLLDNLLNGSLLRALVLAHVLALRRLRHRRGLLLRRLRA